MGLLVSKRVQAERDIEECFVFIGVENPDAAVDFIVSVQESLDQLSEFPYIGKQFGLSGSTFESLRVWHVRGLHALSFVL